MPKLSAGLLMYRRPGGRVEVLLVHPGGPFFARKDLGVWTLPKGEYGPGETPLDAACREFFEETSFPAIGPFVALGEVKQKSGKIVTAWGFESDCDPAHLVSNTCEIEWPPKSRRMLTIPEIDQGRWFTLADARTHIMPAQEAFLDRLALALRL